MSSVGVSDSFAKLRLLADTFPTPDASARRVAAQKRALRLARELGDTAIPLLARKLRAPDDEQASWAYCLLVQLGGERAVEVARALALDDAVADGKKALALALLSELGAELPDEVTLRDPGALRDGSVRELVATLAEPADVARAADLLIAQVVSTELGGFMAEIVQAAGGAAAPLLDEMALRDDVDPGAAAELAALRRSIAEPATTAPATARPSVLLLRHEDGGRAVLACSRRRREAGRTPRARAVCFRVTCEGTLGPAEYDDDLAAGGLAKVRARLARAGFAAMAPPASGAEPVAARLVAAAARRTRAAGDRLPREYFLGRDLLGLWDEHLHAPADAAAPLLERAATLLEQDDPAAALPLAERFVAACPDDPDGRALLASCLVAVDRAGDALQHFAAAARLEPGEPLHKWNLSYTAKHAGKLGACYLALTEYVRSNDDGDGAAERSRTAKRFLRLFEKLARVEHPDSEPMAVARAEELFDRAYAHLAADRLVDAVSGFEAVLKIVPSHYPSWSNLGVAFVTQGRRAEAERCLRKALEYRPDYEVAIRNLAFLTGA